MNRKRFEIFSKKQLSTWLFSQYVNFLSFIFYFFNFQTNTGLLLSLRQKLEPVLQELESILHDLPGGWISEILEKKFNV